jgi:Uma2 family endonuclease
MIEELVLFKSTYETERNKPMPDKFHAYVQQQLLFLIKLHYRHVYQILPELNILFKEEKRVPDLSLFPLGTIDFKRNETNVSKTPIGIIEILSGQQALSPLIVKLEEYMNAGVKSYWLVLPELKSIYVFHTSYESLIFDRKSLLKDDVLGIELSLQEVFEAM